MTKRIDKLVMGDVSNWHHFNNVSFNINRKRNEKIIVVDWCVCGNPFAGFMLDVVFFFQSLGFLIIC